MSRKSEDREEGKSSRENRLARLFRALTMDSQVEFGQRTGLHPSTIGQYERGAAKPGPGNLKRLAAGAGLTVADGDEILGLCDTLREPQRRQSWEVDSLLARMEEGLHATYRQTYERLLRLPSPARPPGPKDQRLAEGQIAVLRGLGEKERFEVVRLGRDLQTLALADQVAEEALEASMLEPAKAAGWARLALEIAEALGPPAQDQTDEVRSCLSHIEARARAALTRVGEDLPPTERA